MSTAIATILATKGHEVLTARTDDRLADAVGTMTERNVGAVVVVDDAGAVVGILSERDVVRRLGGGHTLDAAVGEVMTTPVTSCTSDATTDQLMATMTERRFRHLPVVDDGRLVGIVSIGDVVKWRLDELHTTAEQLTEYVSGTY